MNTALVPRPTSEALLPHTYEAAKIALANCTAVDECQDWADKAAALASYARQRDDDSLFRYAQRIQGRAVRRCGELLKQFDGRGGDQKSKTDATDSFDIRPPTQRQAAEAAGMTERQQVSAVRVANIPEEEFSALIESPTPPSVSKLADMGKRVYAAPKPRNIAAVHLLGDMRSFVERCRQTAPEVVAAAVDEYEVAECREMVAVIDAWTDRFVTNLKG